jgi:hypothetical protein
MRSVNPLGGHNLVFLVGEAIEKSLFGAGLRKKMNSRWSPCGGRCSCRMRPEGASPILASALTLPSLLWISEALE